MHMFSLSFVYLFLPAMLLLCLLLPVRLRPVFLTAVSAAYYLLLERENLILLAGVILFDYGMALLMSRCRDFQRLRKAIMVCSVVKSIVLIAYYSVVNQLNGTHVPLGLGVYCLTSMGYMLECYRGSISCERSLMKYALFAGFFPKLYAGPLVSYSRLMPQIDSMRVTLKKIGQGASFFIRGLAKKVILGDTMLTLFQSLQAIPTYDTTVLTVWSMVVAMAFAAYFILSGLCDMAKGLGLMFGMELPDNFSNPYCSLSINEFFGRFNITVNRFLRRHVYLNLGATQGSMISGIFNILLVTILMGLWFGVSVNLLLWGVYFTVFIILERYVLLKYIDFISPLFRWIYCLAVVLVSFAIFIGKTPSGSLEYLKIMFGFGNNVAAFDNRILYLLASNYLALLVSAICSGNLPGKLLAIIKKHAPKLGDVASIISDVVILMLATAFLL